MVRLPLQLVLELTELAAQPLLVAATECHRSSRSRPGLGRGRRHRRGSEPGLAAAGLGP